MDMHSSPELSLFVLNEYFRKNRYPLDVICHIMINLWNFMKFRWEPMIKEKRDVAEIEISEDGTTLTYSGNGSWMPCKSIQPISRLRNSWKIRIDEFSYPSATGIGQINLVAGIVCDETYGHRRKHNNASVDRSIDVMKLFSFKHNVRKGDIIKVTIDFVTQRMILEYIGTNTYATTNPEKTSLVDFIDLESLSFKKTYYAGISIAFGKISFVD